MRKGMITIAVVGAVLTPLLWIGYWFWQSELLLSFAITAGTTTYHFVMRLLVGYIYDWRMHNRANYERRWFQPLRLEAGLYRFLRVKAWKGRMPSYDPTLFSHELHSWHEIAQAMCQAELVHETIVLLSFLPVFAVRWFGAEAVFWCTSAAAALFDLLFVVMQRYNRPRVVRLAQKEQQRTHI